MTAKEWAERIANHANTAPPYKEGIRRIIEAIQREAWEEALASIQPMPGSELSMQQIDEMTAFVEKISACFKNRTSIDVMAWEQLPEMFRKVRDYALFLRGPLSDVVNDNSAHFDNWARARAESYNQAVHDCIGELALLLKKCIEGGSGETVLKDLAVRLQRLRKEKGSSGSNEVFNDGIAAARMKLRQDAQICSSLSERASLQTAADNLASLFKKEPSDE